jgi:ribosomal protein S18 acetylase RimI-like enzyme
METRSIALAHGDTMVVRPAAEADVPGLARLYGELSPDDLRRRFFSVYHPSTEFLTRVARGDDGRIGLVAVVPDGRIVAEADYAPLVDGDAEFAIVVAPDWRGWLGPYLLDALVDEAAERGVPNLQAEILVENRPMLALVRARGYAMLDGTDYSVVRVTIGTSSDTPTWPRGPGARERPRVLVESPGGRWRHEQAARDAGFDVVVCPGPARGTKPHCPILAGEPCPLAGGADAVVYALRADDQRAREVRTGLGELHPGIPVCSPPPSATPEEVMKELRRVTARRGTALAAEPPPPAS